MTNLLNRSTTIPVEVYQDQAEQPDLVTPISDSIFFSYLEAFDTIQLTADELKTLANIHMSPPALTNSLVAAARQRLAQD